MLDFLGQIDESLFLAMHHMFRSEIIDRIMWWLSDRWIWIPMYCVVVFWLIKNWGYRKGFIIIFAIVLATICTDQCCASLIRPVMERLRPAHPDNPLSEMVILVNDYRGGMFGFPSCHAANTFMLATFLTLISRTKAISLSLYLWAVLNCISRIYLGVHYPGDILFGALIGIFFAILWFIISRFFIKKLCGYYENIKKINTTKNYLIVLVETGTIVAIILTSIFVN